ncbi:MAG: hypothetical protein UX39_C0024G0007 [Candidatus Magasanikbacteria bacterium GW2011_GWA2_46_17]|uniref:Uncharacterized protein n=1 Tax=Candidatus Magasanikbacteria bacterium GW2011_GWA2_46_17 TaxID=1619042 RepID=A0A0G1NZ36_9BACT|nr:MAG: hypothetical protein UX39_C0024G0007 [Candidatus Magasanikbacteria bacterium GW2011_GWA2_46_17]
MALGSDRFNAEFDEAHRTCSVPGCGQPIMTGECYLKPGGTLVELCPSHTKIAQEAGIHTMSREEYRRQTQPTGLSVEQIAEQKRQKDLAFLKGL